MPEDLIGYDTLTQDAARGVVRAALSRANGPNGLPGRHHFYITFRTRAPGVVIPDFMLARFPEEMTIVLEHQFWDLEILSDRFRVILKFGGQPHSVAVPYAALTRFFDPSVRFGLQFDAQGEDLMIPPTEETAPHSPDEDGSGSVVSLDAFRKK